MFKRRGRGKYRSRGKKRYGRRKVLRSYGASRGGIRL